MLVWMMCLQVLRCWLLLPCLSLRQVSPDLHFWSDTSAVGWRAHLDCQVASGLWDPQQTALSINAGELLALPLGLFQFRSALQGRTVAVFCDNTTAVTSLRKEGGTWSPLLNTLASGDLALEGVPLHPPGSTVPSGLRQRPSRRCVSPSPAPTSRVVSTHDRLCL